MREIAEMTDKYEIRSLVGIPVVQVVIDINLAKWAPAMFSKTLHLMRTEKKIAIIYTKQEQELKRTSNLILIVAILF